MSRNIGISSKIIVFWNHFQKVASPIYPKISKFREKLHYFEITLKKSFFVHIAENNIISRNVTFFEITIKKSFFTHISEYIEYIVNRFWCILPKIYNSSKTFFEKIVFWEILPEKKTFREKLHYQITLKKVGFCPKFRRKQHNFEKSDVFWDYF